jgi:hypothetical protein
MDQSKTYVHEGQEVKWTGRTAVKSSPTAAARGRIAELMLVEITPVEEGIDWKKWVREQDLYAVTPGSTP